MKNEQFDLNWFQDWFAVNYQQARVEIVTLDNPGWTIKVYIPGEEHQIYVQDATSPNRVFCKQRKEKVFKGFSGVNNLSEIISTFNQWVEQTRREKHFEIDDSNFLEKNDVLDWLQKWYGSNCNGDWEHSYGVVIKTIPKIGWDVLIDLAETLYSDRELIYKKSRQSDSDWYSLKVSENKFLATGGPKNLNDILSEFKDWISSETK